MHFKNLIVVIVFNLNFLKKNSIDLSIILFHGCLVLILGHVLNDSCFQESFLPQSYGAFKQRDISETIDFFDMICRTIDVSPLTHNRNP